MSLGLALSNALSGININQTALSVTSNNITNANAEGYNRKSVQAITQTSAGNGTGATPETRRIVDQFLTDMQRAQSTSTAKAAVMKDYMERLQVYLGKPGSNEGASILTSLDNFFSAISNVSASPDQSYFRTQAVARASDLAASVSGLAMNLERSRYDADKDLAAGTKDVNNILDRLNAINVALRESYNAGQNQEDLLDQRDQALRDITGYLDIGVNFNEAGQASVFNQAGELLSPTTRYHLSYSPAGSAQTFVQDEKLGAIDIVALDNNGNETGYRINLATSGKSAEITTAIKDGKLKGLMELRDTELPKMLEQLDSLAISLRDQVNKLNNNGVGYPPPSSLTGTTAIPLNREVDFTGQARIAVLQADGTPSISPYSNDAAGVTRPLTIDFGKIYGPNGIGKPTVDDIVNEINQFYDAPSNRVSMGTLGNVQLVAISDNTAGPFQFDLQFDNAGKNALNISILSVAGVPTTDTYTALPGTDTRTAPSLTYTAAGAGPYSIDVQIQFVDPTDGNTYTDTITYNIPAAASGLRNDRYSVASLAGGAVLPALNATIVVPSNNNRLATAQLVDINGNPVTNPSTPAYLQIVGNGTNARIAIDEMNSNEPTTGRAFSHFFELNNLFNPNNSALPGSDALNLSVKQSIINNPSLLSVGQLEMSNQPSGGADAPVYAYGIGVASNSAAEAMIQLQNQSITFRAAGSLSAASTSVAGYASEIYAYAGGAYNTFNNILTQQQIIDKTYTDRMDGVSGVNIDEELANTVLFQNAYSASARMITVVSTLFDVLLQIKS